MRRWHPYSWSNMPFRARPWQESLDRYFDLASLHPEHLAMVEIIDSVVRSDVADRLAGNYTIGGLHVADVERCEPPYSVITVETQIRGRSTRVIGVWHVSSSGLREEIVVPADSAVPLFWRFMIEKFGFSATPSGPVSH